MSDSTSALRPARAAALAPLAAVLTYGAVIAVDLARGPIEGEGWLAWVLLGVAGIAYAATGVAALILVAVGKRAQLPSAALFAAGGLIAGLAIAVLFDLPHLSFGRFAYYGLAGPAGLSTASAFRWLLLRGSDR